MAKSLEHLLGGYATNTLTDEEKRQLSEAALKDQALFDALADEEALKALLADPEARRRILASLESSAHPDESSLKGKGRWGWFRQQSSLAWAGSIAAMGLALIFGWQMEKEWGPIVQREQEAAKSSSREEVAFRQKKSFEENITPIQKEGNDTLERKATEIEGVEQERVVAPDLSSKADSHKVDRLRQFPEAAKKENEAVEGRSEDRRQALSEHVTQPPPSSLLSKKQRFDRPVSPSATPESPEPVSSQDQVPQSEGPGRLSANSAEKAALQPATGQESAQELFYAASGFLADEVMEETKGKQKADQDLGGALSKAFKSTHADKAFSPQMQRELEGEGSVSFAKGIRFSFVRHTKDGKDEEVAGSKISGNWKDIRLAVESNMSGYLYVLAPLGNGKWQKLEPIGPGRTGKFQDGIKVKAFQRVEFSLGQITNMVGNLIVSSLSVLIATNPLDDLGQWLGSEVDVSKHLIERVEEANFVVNPAAAYETNLRVDIPIGILKTE